MAPYSSQPHPRDLWFNAGLVGIHSLSLNHADHGLDVVATAARDADGAEALFAASPHVQGAFVLSTCNRVDVYLDLLDEVDDPPTPTPVNLDLTAMLQRNAAEILGIDAAATHRAGTDAVRHLHLTASGLESAVTGEREISGQVRRAASQAAEAGHMSGRLKRAVSEASAASREVARSTELGRAGRSVVDVALDLVAASLPPAEAVHVLIIGTGSYAGAAVAALRTRGIDQIRVHSASGRGAGFARRHGVSEASDLDVDWADLVIACRGLGSPVLTRAMLGDATPVVLDLALNHDADDAIRTDPRITYIDLSDVEAAAPTADGDDLLRAEEIVDRHVTAFTESERQRAVDPAVARLHGMVHDILVDELGRLDGRDAAYTPDEVRKMMHHMAARILHVPSARAREAARAGLGDEYLRALDLVVGIDAGIDARDRNAAR